MLTLKIVAAWIGLVSVCLVAQWWNVRRIERLRERRERDCRDRGVQYPPPPQRAPYPPNEFE